MLISLSQRKVVQSSILSGPRPAPVPNVVFIGQGIGQDKLFLELDNRLPDIDEVASVPEAWIKMSDPRASGDPELVQGGVGQSTIFRV